MMPEGFQLPHKCWKLIKALYGLRISPKLWKQEATRVFIASELKPVPEDPCVFVGDGIIIWFYVDNILIANFPSKRNAAEKLEGELEKQWELTDHGDAAWFLGIRLLRDRRRRRLWLCQDYYIQSIAMRYHLTTRSPVYTPLTTEELRKYEGTASAQDTKLYQGNVGSVQYATTATRPDAAFAASKLSQFLTNPGPEHHRAIDRLICYLLTTCYHAITYCGAEEISRTVLKSVEFASDAAYGDMSDRRSSAGYIIQVYGGPVDWKAVKQPTVTTSTTEAELVALADSGKSLQWWKCFMQGIGFDPGHRLSTRCDNKQTVNLMSSEDAKITTKLRHVDINGHWIRQEVKGGRIDLEWTPTGKMVADGLTKALTRPKHEEFLTMLRRENVKDLIDP
ncbi:uncharacterized protein N7515_009739 [Penicillium bovifimosum]|uniref:Reverse transcriptase Ty1/copia-type domain-containing protein n=1 Tax=Penicillium bovifimosum TaxID=126998 RepID=A0A9W9KTI0_9EURO|nr:uncharacterized protein N7515_009739 [Penicillium bovifimosum]KAJ5120351.1 hypothetical protein N7515_009739 [Penicillium bovifimosum]